MHRAWVIAFAALFCVGQTAAQTAQQLAKGASDTGDVLNYGMGTTSSAIAR